MTNGIKIGEYRPDDADDEIDIRVRYPVSDRNLDEDPKAIVPDGVLPTASPRVHLVRSLRPEPDR